MTRQKKSRKQGPISSSAPKLDKKTLEATSDKKPKKRTGKMPGNRQQEAIKKNKTSNQNNVKKDPRIGSKKPIVLVKESAKPNIDKRPSTAPIKPIAAVRVLDDTPSITEQLAQLEQDEKLQLILTKQEEGEPLTEEQVDYYNNMMDNYEKLSAQLEDMVDEQETDKPSTEELWDKLDSSDLSEYE